MRRRLAAARRSEQDADLARRHLHRHLVDGRHRAARKHLGHALEPDHAGWLLEARRGDQPLQSEQREIGDHRQHADGQRAGDQLPRIGLADSAGDEGAEAAGADIGGDRRHADVHHHRDAHARHDHRHGDRQFDLAQALQPGQPHAARRLAQRRIDVVDGGVRVADDRKLRIEQHRDDRRQIADAVADQRQDRDHQAEEGDRRDGDDDRRDIKHAVGGALVLADGNTDGHAREDRKADGYPDD